MNFLAAALLVSAIGLVGNMDYEDEQNRQEHYCEMVKAGHWPAYDNSINCED